VSSFVHQLARTLRIALKRLAFEGIGRDGWQKPDLVLSRLSLIPGMRVADLGSGLGYFTFRLAAAVGGSGVVYAVDTDAELREEIGKQARARGLRNIRTSTRLKTHLFSRSQCRLVYALGAGRRLGV